MDSELQRQFLDHSADKLRQYTGRIGTCLGMLKEEQVWARGGENENAVGNLVLHLCGNVRQWIVSAVGGRPDIRERDREFSTRSGVSSTELMERLQATVEVLESVSSNWPAGADKAHAKLLIENRGEMAERLKAAVC